MKNSRQILIEHILGRGMKRKQQVFISVILSGAVFSLFFFSEFFRLKWIQPDVKIWGPVHMADGIPRQTVELAQALKDKYTVEIKTTFFEKTDVPQSILPLLNKKYQKKARVVIIEDIIWHPGLKIDRFFKTTEGKDQIRVAYSMWEATQIIPQWVLMMNLYFDAVIVPDPFLVDVYKNSGVTLPVFYIPLGLDLKELLKAPLKEEKKEGPFIFAALSSGLERKNLVTTIKAFAKALGNNPGARLYINCRFADPDVREAILSEIQKQGCSNISYTEFQLKKDAYVKFLKSVDCLLSLTKGEGFSIQPREAMALGIPVIVSDNTAQSTICKTGLVKVVPSAIAEPAYPFHDPHPCGHQFNCDVDEAALAIEDVYNNYQQYLSKGPLMRKWASGYDYSELTPIYESIVSPKQVILGKTNEFLPDGTMITDSEQLYNKYVKVIRLDQPFIRSDKKKKGA